MRGDATGPGAGTPTSTYRERRPSAALAGHVLCVWKQAIGDGATELVQPVLPDGCADVVWIGAAPPVVAGPATGPVLVPLAPRTEVVGVRLRPGAAQALLGVPASELLNRDTPLRELWGAAGAARAEGIGAQPSPAARLGAAEAALVARLAAASPPDRLVAAAAAWLARHPAGRVAQLARMLDSGERLLHRRFTAAIGYGPKTFQRVLRLQRVLALASHSPQPGAALAGLAAAAGYADQAHMGRELQALAGQAPSALLRHGRSTLELSDLFKTSGGAAS